MSVTSRRRWFTFRLRTFLLAVTALAIWLGWWVNGVRQQRIGVAALQQAVRFDAGTPCYYDYSIVPLKNYYQNTYPFESAGIGIDDRAVPAEPKWFLDRFGVDFFHNVVAVNVSIGMDADSALDHVGRFRRLRHLYVDGHDLGEDVGVSNTGITRLAGLKELKSLYINYCITLTDDSLRTIGGLRELELLRLWNCRFSDEGLAHLKGLSRLKHLLINHNDAHHPDTRITDKGLANFADCVDLEQLDIDSPQLTSEGLKHLAKLKKLTRLELSSPRITDDGLRYLADLPSLSRVELNGADIDGSGFRHLRGHQKLKNLHLAATRLNDEGLAQLVHLPALELLYIKDTQVTAAGLEQLKACPNLKVICIWNVPGDINHLKAVLFPRDVSVTDVR